LQFSAARHARQGARHAPTIGPLPGANDTVDVLLTVNL
jgi:hypothetical protein